MTIVTNQSNKLSTYNLPIFKSELTKDIELRVLGTPEEPWFIAKDIALMLEYKDTKKAVDDNIDKEDILTYKQLVENTGDSQSPLKIQPQTKLINESGLYSLILRSKLEKAKIFKRWVTSEVIPSIRKTGQYKIEESIQQRLDNLQQTVETVTNENLKIKSTYSHLAELHDQLRMKRNYHKFKKGNCVYIITDRWREKDYLKIGYTDNINERLRTYRTSMPHLNIEYLIYLTEHKILEKCLMLKYSAKLVQKNHEYVIDASVETLVKSIKSLTKYLNIDAKEENELALYNEPYKVYNLVFVDQDGNIEDNTDAIDIDLESEEKKNKCESEPEPEPEPEVEQKTEPEIYKCDLCPKEYKSEGTLVNHLKKVHNQVKDDGKTCQICKKIFRDRGKRNRHIQAVHENNNKVKCLECDKEFSSNDSMMYHIRNVHKKIGMSKCDECGKVCSSIGNLKKHIAQIHDKTTSVTCDICEKKFNSQCNLTQHIIKVHNREEKCKCKLCGKELMSAKGMEYHMKNTHKV